MKKRIKIIGIGAIVFLSMATILVPAVNASASFLGHITGLELDDHGRVTKMTFVTQKGEVKEINVNPALFSMEAHRRLKEAYHFGKLVSLDCHVSIGGSLWLRAAWIYITTASGRSVEYCISYWMCDWSHGTS